MARKRGTFGKLVLVAVLGLAALGAWTVWHTKPARDGYTAAKRTVEKAGKAAEAAGKAWGK